MTFPAEAFYRAATRASLDDTTLPPFNLKLTKVPTLSSGLVTLSPNTANEEIVYYSSKDDTNKTINITKRGINWSSQALTTGGAGAATGDYDNSLYMKKHSQGDNVQCDITHLHLIQDYAALQTQINAKVNTAGGLRTGLTANSVILTGPTGEEVVTPLAGFAPTGGVISFAGVSAPTGYLLCDGAAVSRTTYSALFSIVSTTYGVGNGTTTFNVPNLKGRVPVGLDSSQTEFDTLSEVGGEKTHTLTESEMPSHTHGLLDYLGGGSDSGSVTKDSGVDISGTYSTVSSDGFNKVQSKGGGTAHNNLQPYITLNYIIKT